MNGLRTRVGLVWVVLLLARLLVPPAAHPRGALMQRTCLLFVVLASLVHGAFAHESRPAYLELKETVPGRYDVLWRTPLLAGMRLPVRLVFPEAMRHVTEPREHVLADSVVERRVIDVGTGGWAASACSSSAYRRPSPTCWCGYPC